MLTDNDINKLENGMYKIISKLNKKTITILLKKNDDYYILGELKKYTKNDIFIRFIHIYFLKIT